MIKIGIIGAGNIGGSIISDLRSDEYPIEIVAVCIDRQNAPRTFPNVPTTHNIDDVIDNPDIDVIVECTNSLSVEEYVREKTQNSEKTVFYSNKNFYEENNIVEGDKEIMWQAGVDFSDITIDKIMSLYNIDES